MDEDCLACVTVSPTGNDGSADGISAHPFATIQAAIDWASADAAADPAVFENNDLFDSATLYMDEDSTALTTIGADES